MWIIFGSDRTVYVIEDRQIPSDAKTKVHRNVSHALFMETAPAHPSMKYSAWTFHASDAPDCTTWLTDLTGCKNTSSALRVSVCFLWKPQRSHLVGNIVRRRFVPGMHQDALRGPQIPLGVKTQVWHNVSWRAFYENSTGPTWARKIVRWRFAPQTHLNALCNP
jgi:hypothetical protein